MFTVCLVTADEFCDWLEAEWRHARLSLERNMRIFNDLLFLFCTDRLFCTK